MKSLADGMGSHKYQMPGVLKPMFEWIWSLWKMAEERWCERNSSSEQMQELPPTVLWLLISPGRSCLRVGERNGVSTLKSVLDPSPRFQWYLNRDVGASCSSSDTYSVGKPAHKHHERTFQRQKIHQQSLNSIHLHSRHFLLQIAFFFF